MRYAFAIAAAVALSGAASGAAAQDTASSALQANDATQEAPMTTVDRWLADPSQVFEAEGLDLDEFMWRARPVVVFADSPFDPNFQRQMELLQSEVEELVIRDVVIVTDTDPAARSDVRTRLRPRGFMLALIGKDGQVELRKPLPWDVRELSRSIDKMPLRQQEIEDRRG